MVNAQNGLNEWVCGFRWSDTSGGTGPPPHSAFETATTRSPVTSTMWWLVRRMAFSFLPQGWGYAFSSLTAGSNHLWHAFSYFSVLSKFSFLFGIASLVHLDSLQIRWKVKNEQPAPSMTEKSNSCPDRSEKGRCTIPSEIRCRALPLPWAPWPLRVSLYRS